MRKRWIITAVATVLALWIGGWTLMAVLEGDYITAVAMSGVASVFLWMILGQKGRLEAADDDEDDREDLGDEDADPDAKSG